MKLTRFGINFNQNIGVVELSGLSEYATLLALIRNHDMSSPVTPTGYLSYWYNYFRSEYWSFIGITPKGTEFIEGGFTNLPYDERFSSIRYHGLIPKNIRIEMDRSNNMKRRIENELTLLEENDDLMVIWNIVHVWGYYQDYTQYPSYRAIQDRINAVPFEDALFSLCEGTSYPLTRATIDNIYTRLLLIYENLRENTETRDMLLTAYIRFA